jgi:cardiolipin synthase
MMHAKTAVADGQWVRVGSTNLNPASWIGNWELDVAVEDEGFAQQMEAMFLEDLQHATEIVLSARRKVRPTTEALTQPGPHFRRGRGSTNRAVAGALRIGNAVGAAITNRRALGPAEATVLSSGGLLLLILAITAVLWPWVITVPLAILAGWIGVALLGRAYKLRFPKKKRQ